MTHNFAVELLFGAFKIMQTDSTNSNKKIKIV